MIAASWWLFFRRDLDGLGVRKMSDRQWALALRLVRTRDLAPRHAAKQVAAL